EPTAFNISGSPYHMRATGSIVDTTPDPDQSFNVGNQDRSLKAEAVISPGTITVIKDAVPDGPQDFTYNTTSSPTTPLPSSFQLDDDPTDSTLPNSRFFDQLLPGSYTIQELLPVAGFSLTNLTITETGTANSTKNVSTGLASLTLEEAED